jgi:hypothetical protein
MQWPSNIRRGIWRIYILLTVPWIAALCYVAYSSHVESVRSHGWAIVWMDSQAKATKDRTGENFSSLIDMHLDEYQAARHRRNRALIALPVIPIGLPLLWLAVSWIAAGFCERT